MPGAVRSEKWPIVALSSTEAKYGRADVATCKAVWLKRLLEDLQVEVSDMPNLRRRIKRN